MNDKVSYKDLYEVIDKFRKENNRIMSTGFSSMQKKLDDHCKNELIAFEKVDKRLKPLEKLADRALFLVLILSGIMTAVWQFGSEWLKKQFHLT